MPLPRVNAICLVFDHWHAGHLGCYGNAWLGTPQIDHWAAASGLADLMLAESLSLESTYRSWFTGAHPLAPPALESRWIGLPQLLREAGADTVLWTDEPSIADLPWSDFAERIVMPTGAAQTGADFADTALARCLAQVADDWNQLREPFLGWIHLGSLGQVWDAPLELRRGLVDEDEPLPPDAVEVPQLVLPAEVDPDFVLGWRRAYAGQILLLDAVLGGFFDALARQPWFDRTLVLVMGARGFALGEHGYLGPDPAAPFNESVQIPWLIRLPGGDGLGWRSGCLLSPCDVAATLGQWWSLPAENRARWGKNLLPLAHDLNFEPRDRLLTTTPNWLAVRTASWAGWFPRGEHGAAGPRLFAKPDDRWETNEVANRCPEIVAELALVADRLVEAAQADDPEQLSPLPAELGEIWR